MNVSFFKGFLFFDVNSNLFSLGAKIPPAQDASENENNMETDENVPDLDMSCVIEADHDDPLPMGDSEKEVIS